MLFGRLFKFLLNIVVYSFSVCKYFAMWKLFVIIINCYWDRNWGKTVHPVLKQNTSFQIELFGGEFFYTYLFLPLAKKQINPASLPLNLNSNGHHRDVRRCSDHGGIPGLLRHLQLYKLKYSDNNLNLGLTSLHTVFWFTINCVSYKIKFPAGMKSKQGKLYSERKLR